MKLNTRMIQPLYKRGNKLVWLGWLSAIAFSILVGISSPPLYIIPDSPFMAVLFAVCKLASITILIYGCFLVLKAKRRSQWWLMIPVLCLVSSVGVLAVLLIFSLKDKNTASQMDDLSVPQHLG